LRAWLVTWEWASDSAAVFDRVAAILNPHYSVKHVADYVEFLYVIATSSLSEQAAYAKRSSNNPFRAEIDFNGHVRCGHHPWLHAQPVQDLIIRRAEETAVETLEWHTQPIYRPAPLSPDKVEKVSDGLRETVTRRVVGPVSFQLGWDRLAGTFTEGFEPPVR
jgi:hypothetical protein